jgi:predicted SnoaL-like aldol condensation-catalyzing enzyme
MTSTRTPAPQIPFDSLKQPHWTEQETQNAAAVVGFFQHLMNEHDFELTRRNHRDPYTQHNRAIPDGIEGLLGYVKTITGRFPDYSFDVKRIVASGDIVVLHSHATLRAKHRGDESKGFIITDTFRLEDGQLREHWDAIQPIDFFTRLLFLISGGTIANDNPTF